MGIFNHIQVKVNDIEKARKFYDNVMATLGHEIVLEEEGVVIGYGFNAHDMFEIRQACAEAKLSQAVHIAFNARDKNMVEDFYRKALENGAQCNGKPGYRPQYEDGYYAAFVIDLDGHNIEAVYSERNNQ